MSPMPIAAVTTSMKKIGMRAPTALLEGRRGPGVDRSGCCGGDECHRRLDGSVEAVDPDQMAGGHDLRDDRRHGGHLDPRARRAHRHREEDEPHGVVARHHHEREGERRDGDRGIRSDDQELAVVPVGPDSAEDRDERLGEEPEDRRERHDAARLVLDREVPEHRVLHEHRPQQADGLPAQEQHRVPQPARAIGCLSSRQSLRRRSFSAHPRPNSRYIVSSDSSIEGGGFAIYLELDGLRRRRRASPSRRRRAIRSWPVRARRSRRGRRGRASASARCRSGAR